MSSRSYLLIALLILVVVPSLPAQIITSKLAAAVPKSPAECDAAHLASLRTLAEELDRSAAGIAWQRSVSGADVVNRVTQIINSKAEVDRLLNNVLKFRGQVAPLVAQKEDREFARKYLAITSQLIDLSGRLRFTLRDAINNAVTYAAQQETPDAAEQLVTLVTSRNAFVGADVFAPYLSDANAPISLKLKRNVIDLIGKSGDATQIPTLMRVVRAPDITPDLKLSAVVAIMNIGAPQDWRPGQEKSEPPPPVTASQLAAELAKLQFTAQYDASYNRTRDQLLPRLKQLAEKGNTTNALRTCGLDVFVGDWLLIRNPSPYNQVTDLAPGLFTHVGVVAAEKGSDGKTRLVVVEIPERGDKVPATNVDAYLQRTLHYFFLRHPDPKVAGAMAGTAASVIGNPTQFDLTFRNDRVRELKGKPLPGERIHTYCAGLLHLCAQETEAPLADFFPLIEGPPGGHCLENLKKLGMSIGEDFVSPTGALLSPKLEIVGRCEPMYDPGREVKEAIYDHFADCLVKKELEPSPDAVQALREKLAGLAKYNPFLAQALAKANNVSEHIDLEAAAKAAAVIETLDEIADEALKNYDLARAVLVRDESRLTAPQRTAAAAIRKTHAALYQKVLNNTITPRDLRVALVAYYADAGKKKLDERFFPK
jgi:hypothetical protein